MSKITFLSSNIDRYEDLTQRIDKIKQTFANKLYDFYLLQEIYDDKDLKYITPDGYYSLPVSICGNSIISKFKPIKSSIASERIILQDIVGQWDSFSKEVADEKDNNNIGCMRDEKEGAV